MSHALYVFGGLLFLAGISSAFSQTGVLNDTGQTQCDNGSNVLVACTSGNTGDASAMPRQDARFGRDAAAPVQLGKTGSGAGGFDFTRICQNGDVAGTGVCPGIPTANLGAIGTLQASDWACNKDNVTYLIWSLESGSGNWSAYANGSYPASFNTGAGRCGYNTGWRLPTRRELLSIVNNGQPAPAVDGSYFPATQSTWYWTSDGYAANPPNVWVLNFYDGNAGIQSPSGTNYVRLVRSWP